MAAPLCDIGSTYSALASRTQKAQVSGLSHFNDFLVYINCGYTLETASEDELCDRALLGKYADYLLKVAVHR